MTFPHVYVHVPFCARRCTYCDFAIAVRRTIPVRAYLEALGREVALAGDASGAQTVYLGGGTPSLLGGEGIAALLEVVRAPGALAECTLEANPDDVTPQAAREWVRAGVTRMSIGAQSFHPAALAWMHRSHEPGAVRRAVYAARGAGVRSVSLDLIFALPEQLGRRFADDLGQALALEPDHVSLYGLTVEPGTPLGRQVARGETAPPSEPRYEAEYLEAHEVLNGAGYVFYELSNAARAGHQALHNAAYWRRRPYLGLGPSAHGFDGLARWWNEPAYARWTRRLAAGERPVAGRETLTEPERRLEYRYLALRTVEGMELPQPCPRTVRDAVDRWVREGWAEVSAGSSGPTGPAWVPARVRLTARGWLRLDELVASI